MTDVTAATVPYNLRAIDARRRALRFALVVDTVGTRRETLAAKLAARFGGAAEAVGGPFDRWAVTDATGRRWTVQRPGADGADEGAAQIVSPPLTWADFEAGALDTLSDAVRRARGRVDASCEVRVQVEGRALSAVGVARLATLMHNHEGAWEGVLSVGDTPGHRRLPRPFVRALQVAAEYASPGAGFEALAPAFEAHRAEGTDTALALAPLFQRGAVEFRHFRPTAAPEAGLGVVELRAFVLLALGYVARATGARHPGSIGAESVEAFHGATPAARWTRAVNTTLARTMPGPQYLPERRALRAFLVRARAANAATA